MKYSIRRLIGLLCLGLGVAAAITAWIDPSQTLAQSATVVWSSPVKLPGPAAEAANYPRFPSIAADPWGGIHIVWVQAAENDNVPNMIYYTHSDGSRWSEPHDLFAGPSGTRYSDPYLVCDQTGQLHLLWSSPQGLHYSKVLASEADDVKSWQPVQFMVQTDRVGESRLIVDDGGVLHVVYSRSAPGANVTYMRFEDQEILQPETAQVSDILPGDPQAPGRVRMAIDSRGSLHVVWTEAFPPDWVGRRVSYARSTDGGTSWEQPQDLSSRFTEEDSNTHINISVDSHDHLQVVWVCKTTSRCYRSSPDGGDSWSTAEAIFGSLHGYGGMHAMASDQYGNTYWANLLRYPQGFYYSTLEGGNWTDPPQILFDEATQGSLGLAHWPHLVISQGNRLHLVLSEGDQGALWYVRGQTDQAGTEALPYPSPTTAIAPELTPTRDTPAAEPTATRHSSAGAPAGPESSVVIPPLVWGTAPVAVLLLAVFVADKMRTRR